MRLLLITANPAIERTPWWPVILRASGISAVMILTEQRPRKAGSSLLRNVRKHGPIWIPYRAFLLVRDIFLRAEEPTVAPVGRSPFVVSRLNVASLRDPAVVAQVAEWRADLGLSIGAPILQPAIFRLPTRGTINLHLGRAPQFRGAPPGFWELWCRAPRIGATVHEVDEGLDTGPVLAQAEAPIYPHDTVEAVANRAEELGTIVLDRALRSVVTTSPVSEPQPPGGHTFRMPTLTQRLRLFVRLSTRRWLRAVAPRSLAKRLLCGFLLAIVRPARDLWRTLRSTHPVRIYTYHRVTNLCRDGMTIDPAGFARQLAYLQRFHDIVPLERALDSLRRGARRRRPLAAITFDDAYASVIERAWPAMRRAGMPGCVFVSTGFSGTALRFTHDADSPVREHLRVMSWEELAFLRQEGWSLGGHTCTHSRLTALDDVEALRELTDSHRALVDRLGVTDPAFAYPFGTDHDIAAVHVEMAEAIGYRAVLSNVTGENPPAAGRTTLHRIDLGGDHATHAWKSYAQGFDLARIGVGPMGSRRHG